MAEAYLITFTPRDRFFFGGSQSFDDGFYARSLKYPQPTTVLGCLRHTILLQNGLIKKDGVSPDLDNPKSEELTGTAKLCTLRDDDDNFGVIKKISPAFIVEHAPNSRDIKDILFPIPLDVQIMETTVSGNGRNEFSYISYEKKSGALSSYSGRRANYVIKSTRDIKKHTSDHLGNGSFWYAYSNNQKLCLSSSYKEDNIVIENNSVGIALENKMAKEGMFYIKSDLSLKKGFSFGVIAWIADGSGLHDDVVILGGERSVFSMEVKAVAGLQAINNHPITKSILDGKTNFHDILGEADSGNKIVSISPIICDREITDSFEHAMVDGVRAVRILKGGSIEKSDAICMLPTGSVLYTSASMPNISGTGLGVPSKIGYNQAIKLKRL